MKKSITLPPMPNAEHQQAAEEILSYIVNELELLHGPSVTLRAAMKERIASALCLQLERGKLLNVQKHVSHESRASILGKAFRRKARR